MKITAKEWYAGADPATGEDFTLEAGESREVSKEKAEQLQRDMPERFEFAGAKKSPAKKKKAA